MIDLYSHIFATAKADFYFTSFLDPNGRFKMYRFDEAPDVEYDHILVEIDDGPEDRFTAWSVPVATFHCVGKDTEWPILTTRTIKLRDIFQGRSCFVALGSDPTVNYEVIGSAVFGRGRDPVTERVYRSVALAFGIGP